MVKNLPASAGRHKRRGSIPGSGRSPGKGNGNPPQYFCLEHFMDREVWQAVVHRVTKIGTQLKQLSMHAQESLNPFVLIWHRMKLRSTSLFS